MRHHVNEHAREGERERGREGERERGREGRMGEGRGEREKSPVMTLHTVTLDLQADHELALYGV